MKRYNFRFWALLAILAILAVACKGKIDTINDGTSVTSKDSLDTVVVDSLAIADSLQTESIPIDLTPGNTVTKTYIDTTTGDTVYVDFTFEFEDEKYSGKTRQEKYYIIAPYPVYVLTKDVVDELKRWQELEEETFLDAFDKGKNNLFYIALRKVRTQEEAIKEWKELKAKYPDAKLNFHQVSRTVPIEE